MLKLLMHWRVFQQFAGRGAAFFLRIVRHTSRIVVFPIDFYDTIDRNVPCIFALWHGQHFMAPFICRATDRVHVLISRSPDGSIYAQSVVSLGLSVIRGSGGVPKDMLRKGGHLAFRQMLRALNDGDSVALTADVPRTSRKVGDGIIALARYSGRPIIPIAAVSSRRRVLDNWDRTTINYPFGKLTLMMGAPIFVPDDEAILDQKKKELELALNAVNDRSIAVADSEAPIRE